MNNIRITISSKRHGAIKKNKKIQKENLKKFLKEADIDIDSLTLMKTSIVTGKRSEERRVGKECRL